MRPETAAPSFGVRAFAYGLIATSLVQMAVLTDGAHYAYLFQDLPPAALIARHAASWAARVIGVALGVGLLYRREDCRRATVWLGLGIALTAPLKHPHAGFVRHLEGLQQRWWWFGLAWSLLPLARIRPEDLTWLIVRLIQAQEAALGLLLAWYFSRPSVKAQFRPHDAA